MTYLNNKLLIYDDAFEEIRYNNHKMFFPAGLNTFESKEVSSTLKKLIKYLDLEGTVLVGGLVARYYIYNAGLRHSKPRPLNDIDFVFNSIRNVNPKITSEFKVHHFHKEPESTYLVLFDPENKMKIDFFDALERPVIATSKLRFNDLELKIPTLEDQFVEYTRDCYLPVNIEGFKNKKHYYTDAKLLRELVDVKKAQEIFELMDNKNFPKSPAWLDKKTSDMPANVLEVYEEAMEFEKSNPDRIISTSYSKKAGPVECLYCVKDDPDFSLTSSEEIYKLINR